MRNKWFVSSVGVGQRDNALEGMIKVWAEPKPMSKQSQRSYDQRIGLILWSRRWSVGGQPRLITRSQAGEVPET